MRVKWIRLPVLARLAFLLAVLGSLLPTAAEAARARSKAPAANPGAIKPAKITGTPPAAAYLVQFIARRGPGSITGHTYIRTVAILPGGKRQVTALFGFLPAGENYAEGVFGTQGVVGFNGLDVSEGPTALYSLRLTKAMHARLLHTARRYARSRPHYELFTRNCNWLVGQMARSIGLVAPSEVFIAPEAFVEQLAALNGRRKLAAAN